MALEKLAQDLGKKYFKILMALLAHTATASIMNYMHD